MIKIQRFFLMMILMSACLSHLAAVIKKEVYPFGALSETGDMTILTLEDWPVGKVNVTEKRLLSKETKKLPVLKVTKGVDSMAVVSSLGYTPGVPVTYTFEHSEKGLKEEITFVPNRIFVKSSVDNAQIEAKLISESPAMYDLELEGFGDEALTLRSVSYDEVLESKFPIKEKTISMYLPGVIGKKGGISRLSFTRPSGEVLKLELPWGLEWMKYNLYYDRDGKPKSYTEHPEFQSQFPEMVEYFNSKR